MCATTFVFGCEGCFGASLENALFLNYKEHHVHPGTTASASNARAANRPRPAFGRSDGRTETEGPDAAVAREQLEARGARARNTGGGGVKGQSRTDGGREMGPPRRCRLRDLRDRPGEVARVPVKRTTSSTVAPRGSSRSGGGRCRPNTGMRPARRTARGSDRRGGSERADFLGESTTGDSDGSVENA